MIYGGIIKRLQVLAVICMISGVFASVTAAHSAPQSPSKTFSGQMRITVDVLDAGSRNRKTYKYTNNVEIVIDAPHRVGKSRETNPFSFIIQTSPLENNPGEISLYSAMPFNSTVFQYWTCQSQLDRRKNTTFSCTLTNNQLERSIVLNMITLQDKIAPDLVFPMTYAMDKGATLSGVLYKSGGLSITVKGNTTDTLHPFTIQITTPK